jgi:hypothetical protein
MKRHLRIEARTLRQDGISVREIAVRLGVSKGSVSLWVRDIQLSEEQVHQLKQQQRSYAAQNAGAQANRAKHEEIRQGYQEAGRAKAKEGRPLHLAGCMLYWAEGAKDRSQLYFVNSDPNMMMLFVRFLREELGVTDEALHIRIHCHTNEREEMRRVEQYWISLLRLMPTSLGKTMHKRGSDIVHNTLPNGICGVRVHSTELVQHIFGAIQEYGGFDNPAWLF